MAGYSIMPGEWEAGGGLSYGPAPPNPKPPHISGGLVIEGDFWDYLTKTYPELAKQDPSYNPTTPTATPAPAIPPITYAPQTITAPASVVNPWTPTMFQDQVFGTMGPSNNFSGMPDWIRAPQNLWEQNWSY